MIVFALLATGLTLIALSFLLPGLFRGKEDQPNILRNEINLAVMRDQIDELDRDLAIGTISADQFVGARHDLERRLIEEQQPLTQTIVGSTAPKWVSITVALFIPLFAASLYFFLGNSAALNPEKVAQKAEANEVSEQQIVQMVNTLAEKLKSQPNNVEGWNMLARSYNVLGRFNEAAAAYAHLVKIEPKNADYLVSYADTLAVTLNKNLQGEPEKLVKQALVLDPQNVRGLSLAGSAAFDRQDYADAIAYWKEVLALVSPDSDMARDTLASIGEAQSLINGNLQTTPSAVSTTVRSPIAATKLSGTVELAPEFKTHVADTDTVYIFARAEQGPPYPLAVKRAQVKDLPLRFVLDDSMSVMPNAHLAGHTRVMVGARISKSGNATPETGDLESSLQTVAVGTDTVAVTINTTHR